MIITDEQIKQRYLEWIYDRYELKVIVLTHYLAGENAGGVLNYKDGMWSLGDYLVLTDEEAHPAVREKTSENRINFNGVDYYIYRMDEE